MKFACPECNLGGEIEDSKIPEGGAWGTCPKCKTRFNVKRELPNVNKNTPAESTTKANTKIDASNESNNNGWFGTSNREQLQSALNYRLVRKTLELGGLFHMFLGAIITLIGIMGIAGNSHNVAIPIVLSVLGVIYIVTGVWFFYSPSVKGMLVNGITFVLLGICLIPFIGLFFIPTLIGVSLIVTGSRSFERYKRLSKFHFKKPLEETINMIDEYVKAIAKVKAKEESDYIKFKTTTFASHQTWKGKLSKNEIFIADNSGHDVIFATKDEIEINKIRKSLIGKNIKVSFRIRDRKLTGSIAPEFLNRYEGWKKVV
ncbi:MAG: zinc-ribbon domain-containing protein [Desulfuromonadaceae bacterium]|nr:zinc-ribbon domain-containing protein [Desulfuromonadaceae bacterium]MDD2855841.1 zinc-ribbon domain-containing protein [Desulfuromonadaceae bacterium]